MYYHARKGGHYDSFGPAENKNVDCSAGRERGQIERGLQQHAALYRIQAPNTTEDTIQIHELNSTLGGGV